jgi:hypothetical protein
MTALAQLALLLGQQPASASERFPLATVAFATIVCAICLWALRRWAKAQPEETYCSPARLWRELCHAHQLSRSQIRLLKRIATREQLSVPCELFVERTHLERAAQSADFSRHSRQIAAITMQLFGSSG